MQPSHRNLLIASAAAIVVLTAGYFVTRSGASGFFAAAESESGTLSGNATVINDASASDNKAIQFNAPPVTPPPSGGGGGGGTTPPSSRPDPFPASMKPDASNTGVVPGTTLTVVNGSQTYGPSANGQTISGKDFHGFITVTGANITFVNCIFRGQPTSSNHALLDTEDSTGTITVKDSEFVPSNPSATIDGLATRNTNLYRVNIHGGVDGMKADSNTLVQDSYIHDMSWFANDPNQGGTPTHNDGAQSFAGESNVTLRHNNIDMSTTNDPNAALQSSAPNTHVENNWLDGGGCTLNFAAQPYNGATMTNIYITGNRFGRHQGFTGCAILISNKTVLSQNSGNVWDDTGLPIPAPQQHD
ncbi:MAG TPA: hypothetical protein VLI54_00715 [Bacillota bacterium]|nr:hypothetical protein [Bacillota bacterium]